MAKRRRAREVELGEDNLPIYKEEDVEFVVQLLPKMPKPCTIPKFCKNIGHEPRPFGGPGKVYQRILAAFKKALEDGRISKHGWNYRVTEKAS
jgi:hypothetical protein